MAPGTTGKRPISGPQGKHAEVAKPPSSRNIEYELPVAIHSPIAAVLPDSTIRFVPRQVIVISSSLQQASLQARAFAELGFRALRRHLLPSLGLVYSVFGVPAGMTSLEAKIQLQILYPQLTVDVNHRYQLQGTNSGPRQYAAKILGWRTGQTACSKPVRVGLIDTGVDVSHPALQRARITRLTVIPAGYSPAPLDHGTGVAALLLGRSADGRFHGVLPAASMIAVSSFIKRPQQPIETTAEWLARALDLLAGHKVQVINMSLGGGRDRLLDLAIQAVQKQAIVVVAAAGNSGLGAAPVFPAAYSKVIAVTAVDARLRILRNANRGSYVEFAAPGVDVWSARAANGGKYYSGTSFSAPFVTAAVARLVAARTLGIDKIRARLRARARDLGAPGWDPVFGYGLIQFPQPCGL